MLYCVRTAADRCSTMSCHLESSRTGKFVFEQGTPPDLRLALRPVEDGFVVFQTVRSEHKRIPTES